MTTIANRQSQIANGGDRPCQKCRCPLTFVPNVESGKLLPLDTRAAVYVVFNGDDGKPKAWDINSLLNTAGELHLVTADGPKKLAVRGVHVSHFSTCPAAGSFSKKGFSREPDRR